MRRAIYRTVAQVAAELGVIPARVRALCGQGRIIGARREPGCRPWIIPAQLQSCGTYEVQVTPATRGPALRSSAAALRLSESAQALSAGEGETEVPF